MGLYSNCCLQRDLAIELLNDGKLEEAKAALSDWPDTTGSQNVPQLLFETPVVPKRKKRSAVELECDGVVLIKEMEDNYIRGERVHFDVPNVLPEGDMSLAENETHIKECENCFKTVENYVIQNAFAYENPATMGLLALNRYIRIVKTNHYNGIFSPRKSKIWLSCVWLSLALYLLIARVTNWSTFEFIPGYAVCSVAFSSSENRIIHYSFVLGLFFILPFSIGLFSYFKIFLKIRQHKFDVAPSLQNSRNQAGRISMQEINMSRALSYVAAGFLLCWIPMWGFTLWKRFSPDTASRIVELSSTFFLFLSSTINPFIYAAKNRAFREEFRKLLCWWKKGSTTSEAGSCARRKRCRGGKTPESSTSWPESFLSLPGDCKERDWRNPGNEVAEIFL